MPSVQNRAIRLRAADPSEAGSIAAMARLQVEYGLRHRFGRRVVRRLIENAHAHVIVADDRGDLAGIAAVRFASRHGHLLLLAVMPRYRGRGVAPALLGAVERRCRQLGVRALRLEARAGNRRARRFYRRHGYCLTGVMCCHYERREAAAVMTRRLL